MKDLLLLVLIVTSLVLLWQLIRLWFILRDLSDAVESKASYLQQSPSRTLRLFKLENLVQHYAKLLENERKMKDLEYDMHNQIEAVLGKIQEAVCSIDPNNQIIHSNKAACDVFNEGKPIHGKRIEELIRNPEFLDSVHQAKNGRSRINREISIRIADRIHWFEVSATPIPKTSSNPYGSVIFVFHDITRLKDLEIVKNNFVANVSHELKTPITIIKGFTETLIDEGEGMDAITRNKFLRKIESNSERLNLIVQDLLTLSRIESEPEFLKKTPTPIVPLLEGIEENQQSLLKPSQTLTVINEAGEFTANIDGFKITQVIQNLIDNAIRYSDEDSAIEVRVSVIANHRTFKCRVCDTGKGIPEEDLPNIFRRFYRVDKARSRLKGGTGLGLSIARGIIQLHNGSISAYNRPEGGFCVEFTLPM